MSIADYGAQTWAGVMFGLASLPAHFYLALCTGEPGDGWDGTVLATVEPPASSGYARMPLAVPGAWQLSDAGFVANSSALNFPTPTSDWGQISFWAITDAATAGQLWQYEAFTSSIYVAAGASVILPAGSLVTSLTEAASSIAQL